jgi:hypothetical protein
MESDVSEALRTLQARHPAVQIGCYPYFGTSEPSLNLVLRSRSDQALSRCKAELRHLLGSVVKQRRTTIE